MEGKSKIFHTFYSNYKCDSLPICATLTWSDPAVWFLFLWRESNGSDKWVTICSCFFRQTNSDCVCLVNKCWNCGCLLSFLIVSVFLACGDLYLCFWVVKGMLMLELLLLCHDYLSMLKNSFLLMLNREVWCVKGINN